MPAARITSTIFLALMACAASLGATFGRAFSVPEYVAELDKLSALATEAGNDRHAADTAIVELRGDWTLVANGQQFKISTGWMVDRFERLKREPDDLGRDEIIQQLNMLKIDIQDFQHPTTGSTSARSTLTQILARSEFHNVHGPTWLDRLKYRILAWLFRLLSPVFGSSAVPTVGRVLVWTLVGIAVLVLAYFIYRTIRQNARMESFIPQVVPVSAKEWRVWMQEAQAAAAQAHWRDAVHLAYWAGISFLEMSGMWRPEKARTPREYLRLLSPGNEKRAPLSALTRNLELTWYANHRAGPETFAETVALLEKLGCPQA